MTPNDDRLEVRVDPAFKARLKAAAKADHRSLSSFVISRLEAALSSSETPERTYEQVQRERDAVRERPLTSEQEAFIAKTVAERKPLPRGSASPSLERFSKAQRKGGKA